MTPAPMPPAPILPAPILPARDGIDPGTARRAGAVTVWEMFAERAAEHPGAPALELGDRTVSYGALAGRAAALHGWLAGRGLVPGDRVAILSENRGEYVEALMACARGGFILCCQNWRLAEAELAHCLGLVTPRATLASPRYAEPAARLFPGALVFGPDYEAALAAAPEAPAPPDLAPEAGLVILYTSGTTGLPKGALISHRAEIARAMAGATDLHVEPDEAFVAWAPMFHMVSTDSVFGTLMQGGRIFVTDGFDPDGLAAIVVAEKLGRLTLMPGMIVPFLEALDRNGGTPVGVRYAGVMADLVPHDQLIAVTTRLNAPYINSFGSTETGSAPASRGKIGVGVAPTTLDKRQSSWSRLRLVDEDGNDVAPGEPGEAAVRGPGLFSGYWGAGEVNAKDFKDGWFRMGDMFVRNPDGTLSFVDRRKYLIKSGGENIYPAEIERVLLADPRIVDAAVVRAPDPKWGEIPVAFVAARDPGLTEAAVIELCRAHIARYKAPRAVRFVAEAELPRSATGKIKRHELEARLAAETQPV
ncbi:MAG: AMP-binding protein [Pseudomonadota bacterium]|nr:AMP-binding protein [Pseudomonadota bacterium]